MAKIEIGCWEIAEKFGLCFTGIEETIGKFHEEVDYHVFDFHGKTIKIEESYYTRSEDMDYKERAAEIVLFNIGRLLSEGLTDWIE